ncbi:hypothetical protein [Massilimicrobiota sp. An134]|uniref:hypothetical protein n=1 Tax=Massilimicrobiota sp. An134 TaxID=1965557 RepID=UPI000B3A2489|nr:hypothetical protein [Massilimicrobiota sp. An134]OUQ31098.1 hypothetical protein B5E79_00245 [Massilimicrobiota sp. An134]
MKLKDLINKEMGIDIKARYRLLLVCEKRDFARNCWNIRASVKNLLYRGVYEVYKNDDSMAIFETSDGLKVTLITYDCVNDMPEKDVFSLFINESDLYKLLSGISPLDFDDSLKKIIGTSRKRSGSLMVSGVLGEAHRNMIKKEVNSLFGIKVMEEERMENDRNLIVYKSEEEMAKEFINFGKRYGDHGFLPMNYAAISVTTVNQDQKPRLDLGIKNVIFNDPATIILWNDGTKTVVKAQGDDVYDPEKGLTMAIVKKLLGNQGNYYNELKKWLPKEEKVEFGVTFAEALRQTIKRFNETMGKSALSEDEEKVNRDASKF